MLTVRARIRELSGGSNRRVSPLPARIKTSAAFGTVSCHRGPEIENVELCKTKRGTGRSTGSGSAPNVATVGFSVETSPMPRVRIPLTRQQSATASPPLPAKMQADVTSKRSRSRDVCGPGSFRCTGPQVLRCHLLLPGFSQHMRSRLAQHWFTVVTVIMSAILVKGLERERACSSRCSPAATCDSST